MDTFIFPLKKTYWFFREKSRSFLKDVIDSVKTTDVRGKKIRIGFSNPLEGYRIATYESKEPETLDWIDQYHCSGDVFFDIGANIGLYSIYSAVSNSKIQVYSFEPEALNFTRLIRNIRENQLKNIIPLNIPLNDKTKFDLLYVSGTTASSAFHSFGKNQTNSNSSNTSQQPLSVTQGMIGVSLDDLVHRFALPQPQHIKIDVDGIEAQILEGGQKVLSDDRLKSILIEINSDKMKPSPIFSFLEKLNFQIAKTGIATVLPGGVGESKNYIYLRKNLK